MALESIVQKYAKDERLAHLMGELQVGGAKIRIKRWVSSQLAFFASAFFRKTPHHHLFIFNEKEAAAYFFNDLENINQDKKLHLFFYPSSARVPYQVENTENANVLLRAEVLSALSSEKRNFVIVTYPEAIAEKVVTRQHLKENTYEIKKGEEYDTEFVSDLLIDYEFEPVDYVYEPGQFSLRGGIIDIYSFADEYPFRLEFFGSKVDSIRKFDPATQLSIGKEINRSVF